MIKVIPNNKTMPESNICLLNCSNQYVKNRKLNTNSKGKPKVNTDSIGKSFGAKKGKI
ncbi:hypothetical protein GCM10007424_14820 [Flavobacterium suaedae]|uniref:Uncharacterized protein n=1 Tax=Flavobacterium suaedae TaxID=1767027 RepID=A0ABQ1JRQ2_9FLAO|nr:hypothetical protein GCM10007424_14820 [Flavobacterium suaedae]